VIKWDTYEEAIQKSKQDNRPVYLFVFLESCGWCKKTKEKVFTNEKAIEKLNTHFHPAKISIRSEDEIQLEGQSKPIKKHLHYHYDKIGTPTHMIISDARTILGKSIGYIGTWEFRWFLNDWIE
jgi:thioredoxin-related protein